MGLVRTRVQRHASPTHYHDAIRAFNNNVELILRSVDEEERSFALGVQFVIFRLIAYIPAPIMFGSVIDSTCLLWKTSCDGAKGGRCLLYDIEQFRYRLGFIHYFECLCVCV